jgi:uncharacterized protein (TIGR02266 family)
MMSEVPMTQTEKRPGPESRKAPRIPLELDVDFESDHNFYHGFAENISSGGLFIATYDHAEPGDTVDIKFRLPDSAHPIEVTCEVRWVRPYNPDTPDMQPGMGVRFANIRPADVLRIESFVREREPMFFDDE